MASRGKNIAHISMDPTPQARTARKVRIQDQSDELPSTSRRSMAGAVSSLVRLLDDEQRAERPAIAMSRWQEAAGNLEDARLTFNTIADTINDAIYLDEDAYNQMTPVMRYTETIQAQERRIQMLEQELSSTKHRLEESNAIQTEALNRHADMQQELENNAVVFNMHFEELLRRDTEIKRLKDRIEELTSKDNS